MCANLNMHDKMRNMTKNIVKAQPVLASRDCYYHVADGVFDATMDKLWQIIPKKSPIILSFYSQILSLLFFQR